MKTNKNIDRLFQEKLKDFEASPPDAVWKNIEHRLKNKDSKPLFPLWMRISSIAVIGLILIVSSINYFSDATNKTDANIITGADKNELPKIDEEGIKTKLLESLENNKVIATEIDKKTPIKQPKELKSTIVSIKKRKKVVDNKNIQEESNRTIINNQNSELNNFEIGTLSEKDRKDSNSQVAINILKEKEKNTIENLNIAANKNTVKAIENQKELANNLSKNKASENEEKTVNTNKISKKEVASTEPVKNLDDLLKEDLTEDLDIKKEEDTRKWSVASMIAPVYYNSFNTSGSPLDLKFENSPKQGSKTISYGVKIAYKLNDKLSLQSGVSLMNVGYKIGDVYINPSQQGTARLTNVNYTNTATLLNINTASFLNSNQFETSTSTPIRGILNQEFGYIEVPLELKYSIRESNRKLGINLIGGFSTLFLNKNEVSVETSQFSSNLGEANNLNNINFSGNLGLDVDYKINKNFYFNVAPMLKIHTSTFSKNDGSFKPYTLGVYTGLNYKF